MTLAIAGPMTLAIAGPMALAIAGPIAIAGPLALAYQLRRNDCVRVTGAIDLVLEAPALFLQVSVQIPQICVLLFKRLFFFVFFCIMPTKESAMNMLDALFICHTYVFQFI